MRAPTVGHLNRVIRICRAQDVITIDGEFSLARTGIRDTWAFIEPLNRSTFSKEGMAAIEEKPTHRATIRAMADLDLTVAAWVHEARTISSDVWYKILGYSENFNGQWWQLELRIYSRGEDSPVVNRKQDIPL